MLEPLGVPEKADADCCLYKWVYLGKVGDQVTLAYLQA